MDREGMDEAKLGEGNPAQPVRRVTIRDVARLANTSISTVSAAFNGSPGVADHTRTRIFAAANRLGWRPDRRASHLRRNRTTMVGVVYEVEQSFQSGLLDHLYLAARGHDLEIFLAGATEHNSELTCVRLLLAERVNAVILTGSNLTDEQFSEVARQVPTLSLCRDVDAPGVDVIKTDGIRGVAEAVNYLHSLGHQRIAHVSGGTIPMGPERERGYRQAMSRLGLSRFLQVWSGGDTPAAGVMAAEQFLALAPEDRPTGITCFNDMSAHALIRRLHQAGLDVPGDVSVVGFDNAPISRDALLPLTTVAQPVEDMTVRALQLLADRIQSGLLVTPGNEYRASLDSELIIRATTGPRPDK
ncbi:LacI family DNA-binding transcriptional regulator [Actinomyces sp. F1_1611]